MGGEVSDEVRLEVYKPVAKETTLAESVGIRLSMLCLDDLRLVCESGYQGGCPHICLMVFVVGKKHPGIYVRCHWHQCSQDLCVHPGMPS